MSLIILSSQTLASGQTVWMPSSNDWDYSFDGGGEWPAAGNALGDHEEGGYVDNTGGDSCLYSLITLDGDFEIEFTATGINNGTFGVFAINEDDDRTTAQKAGCDSMTNSYWHNEPDNTWRYGNSSELTQAVAAGSVVKIVRTSGTIEMFDDGASAVEFGTDYSGTMRFFIGSAGSPFDLNYDDIKITDSEGIQRDGFWDEGAGPSRSFGGGTTNMGGRWKASRSGSITSVKVNVAAVSTGFTAHAEIWLGDADGSNPASQVGSDSSNTQSFSSTGDKTFNFTDVTIDKGKYYWVVLVDDAAGSGDVNMAMNTSPVGALAGGANEIVTGRDGTITSIADTLPNALKMEIVIDTSAGEPTPDHDTLLLIHSDTSDASTTFVDSSQFGRTDTVNGEVQHDTAQKKFGASSILFDGTGDYLTIPDSDDFAFGTGGFTVECWFRLNGSGKQQSLVSQSSAYGTAGTSWQMWVDLNDKLRCDLSSGSSQVELVGSTTLSTGTWYHAAYVRVGDLFTGYLDGTSNMSTTNTMSIQNVSAPVSIGVREGTSYPFDGWIDEVRISRVARWDANFTPPTAPYPTD